MTSEVLVRLNWHLDTALVLGNCCSLLCLILFLLVSAERWTGVIKLEARLGGWQVNNWEARLLWHGIGTLRWLPLGVFVFGGSIVETGTWLVDLGTSVCYSKSRL